MTYGTYPWSFVTDIFTVAVDQAMVVTVKRSTTRNPWFSSFLVSGNPLSRCRSAGMFLHINGKFSMRKLK
jgi:hypothetical protein